MKKLNFLLLCLTALLLSSCLESKFEMHQTYFSPQHPGGMKFYADQTLDSVRVNSYDSWEAYLETPAEWMSITPTEFELQPGYFGSARMDISMEENNTGNNRQARIFVKSYHTISMAIYQYAWLNIQYPTPIINGENFDEQTVRFELAVGADPVNTSITFFVYQNNAQLSSDSPWVVPETTTFSKGQNTVKLNIEPNNSEEPRTAMLILTSGSISTPIYIKQNPKEDEE